MTGCLGHWVLVPELSHYSAGGPPDSGDYRVAEVDGEVRFSVDWVKDGTPFSVAFPVPADGSVAVSAIPGVDRFWLERGEGWLATIAEAGGVVIARAMRRVSADGQVLSVLQENADGQGGWVRIFQVYRRA